MKFTGEFFIPGKTSNRIAKDHLARYEFATKFVKNKRVLDIACGTGYGAQMLLQAGAKKVDAVDISKQVIRHAKKEYKHPQINFNVGDVTNFGNNRSYDVVVSFETIEHVVEYKKTLANLHRVLKRNGLLIISSPNRIITSPHAKRLTDKPLNKFHTQEFTKEELSLELKQAGFKVKRVYGQRYQYAFQNRFAREIYRILFKPDLRSSSLVSQKNFKQPKYMVFVAKKK